MILIKGKSRKKLKVRKNLDKNKEAILQVAANI